MSNNYLDEPYNIPDHSQRNSSAITRDKKRRNKPREKLKNKINNLVFSVAALVVLLYKYASYISDSVMLRVSFRFAGYRELAEFSYTLSEDLKFTSLCEKIAEDFSVLVHQNPKNVPVELGFEWITDEGKEPLGDFREHIHLKSDSDSRNIRFCEPPSNDFRFVFHNADRHYDTLVRNALTSPTACIKNLAYLSENEKNKLLSESYGISDPEIAKPELLHFIFEKTSDRYPDNSAVVYKGESLTYRELNIRANRLAHYLINQNVKPGDYIGVLLERSPDFYVAMLGILKAGAAYVPLDSEYPEDRILYMLHDSSAEFLISDTSFRSLYSSFKGSALNIDLELKPVINGSFPDHNPVVPMDASAPAYVIYTSGTTGRPKGVVIPHCAAGNLIKAEKKIYQPHPGDKVLQGLSVAFDASIEEIWIAFHTGAALFPVQKGIMCSATELTGFIKRNKITVFSTVPTLLSMMKPNLPSLRLLILGGEACPSELLDRWHHKGLMIFNTYGPTEGVVIATYDPYTPGEPITIGRPVPNYAVFVTDKSQNPVPEGIPGELCIAAVNGVASGYLNRGELTANKFPEAPFPLNNQYSSRIYRSGDLARKNENGNIEFLGRIDNQVKLRGYRIELSEIESRLMQAGNIKNAVVTVAEDKNKVKRLVAYVVLLDPSVPFSEDFCKKFLKSRLAAYMIPSVYVVLTHLPTLPSGKIDRKKLPDPDKSAAASDRSIKKPGNDIEKKIHSVWNKYFAPHNVSVNDNFFLDLGGHSLLAAKTVSDLRRLPDFKDLSVADLYKHPTIEKLAKHCFRRIPRNGSEKNPHRTASEYQNGSPAKNRANGTSNTPDRYIPSRLRHFCCGLLQAAGLYFVFGMNLITSAASFIVFFMLEQNGYSYVSSFGYALVSSILLYPIVIVLAVSAKWLLLGRIKPGRYKLWSWFYVRWWLVQHLFGVLHLQYLDGSPLLPFILRLFGAHIGENVHLETAHFAAFDVTSIGDGTSIDEDASLLGYTVEKGYLIIKPVVIGSGCFVGTRSVISRDTIMEDGARLEDLSLLPPDTMIPSGETWKGSPAAFVSDKQPDVPPPPHFGVVRKTATTTLYALLVILIPIVAFLAFVPGIIVLIQINPVAQPLLYLGVLPPVGASFVLLLTLELVVLKWLLVGRIRPGLYPVHGGFYIRHWIVNQLFRMSLDDIGQLHATLHVLPWYRALGAKIGRFVELSTASSSAPDLIELNDGSTIADEVSLGSPHVEGGWLSIAGVKMGRRAFAGNSAVIPSGSEVGNGSLIGVLSVTPGNDESKKENATWFGSPPILFPKREKSNVYSEARTYEPPRKLRLMRGTFELLRITMPPAGFLFVFVAEIVAALSLWSSAGLAATLLLLPVVAIISSLIVILGVALVKWLIVGRYKPFERPLWSNFVWRLELVNALYEFMSTPLILGSLRGTPFLPWYLRLLGARIGKSCYINTTGFLEWDLVDIGDRAELCEDCIMQTHLFEDRILKASGLRIGRDCKIGVDSVVLYNTVMENGSAIEDLSLLMKGESIPSNSNWIGCPAKIYDHELSLATA